MSETNGTDLKQQLAAARREKALLETQIQTKILKRQATLLESWQGYGTIYDPRDRGTFADDSWSPAASITSPQDRRGGRNWPIFDELRLNYYRQQSRLLCATNSHAKGLLRNLVNYTVGVGPTIKIVPREDLPDEQPDVPGYQPDVGAEKLAKVCQEIIDNFCDRNKMRWRIRELARRCKRDGEAFVRFFDVDQKLILRFVEPEMVLNPADATENTGWTFGIKHRVDEDGSEDVEDIIAYNVVHPYATSSQNGEEVTPDKILHVKNFDEDSTLKRGLPEFIFDTHDALMRAAEIQRAASEGQAMRESFAIITQHATATKDQVQDFSDSMADFTRTNPRTGRLENLKKIEGPQHVHIDKGQEFVAMPAGQGTSLATQISQGDLRQACSSVTAPEYFTGDASNGNYASLRESSAPILKNAEAEQQHYAEAVEYIVRRCLMMKQEYGDLPENLFDFVTVQVEMPLIVQRDRNQQAQENSTYMQMQVKSPQTVMMELGLDSAVEIANWQQWNDEMGGGGPDMGGLFGGGPPGGGGGGNGPAGGGDDLFGQSLEGLLEGFTGTITDKLGRKIHYQDGKRIASGEGDAPAAGKKSSVKDKVIGAAKALIAVSTAMPTLAKETMLKAGFSPAVANAAYLISVVGDYAVPGLPVVSAPVIILATIRKPSAPIAVVKDLIAKVRAMRSIPTSEWLLEALNQDDMMLIGQFLHEASDYEWAVTVLAVAMEDHEGDIAQAVDTARQVLEQNPEPPQADTPESLLEAGFTGEKKITTKTGTTYTRYYVNGKQVAKAKYAEMGSKVGGDKSVDDQAEKLKNMKDAAGKMLSRIDDLKAQIAYLDMDEMDKSDAELEIRDLAKKYKELAPQIEAESEKLLRMDKANKENPGTEPEPAKPKERSRSPKAAKAKIAQGHLEKLASGASLDTDEIQSLGDNIEALTVPQIKAALKAMGQKVSGAKAVLTSRVLDNVKTNLPEPSQPREPEPKQEPAPSYAEKDANAYPDGVKPPPESSKLTLTQQAEHQNNIQTAYNRAKTMERNESGFVPIYDIYDQMKSQGLKPDPDEIRHSLLQLEKSGQIELRKLNEIGSETPEDLAKGAIGRRGAVFNYVLWRKNKPENSTTTTSATSPPSKSKTSVKQAKPKEAKRVKVDKDLSAQIKKGLDNLNTRSPIKQIIKIPGSGRQIHLIPWDKNTVEIDFQWSGAKELDRYNSGDRLQHGTKDIADAVQQVAQVVGDSGKNIIYTPTSSKRKRIYDKLLTRMGWQQINAKDDLRPEWKYTGKTSTNESYDEPLTHEEILMLWDNQNAN